MHTITGVCFLYLQGSSRKAHFLDYHEAECCKLLQNNHTYIPNCNATYSRKQELCNYVMTSELIQCSIRRMLGFMLQDFTFSYKLLHKESKSYKKTSNRDINRGQNWLMHMLHHSILHPAKQCMCWSAQRRLLHFLHATCWYE